MAKIEPGPPGGKPGMLVTRPHQNTWSTPLINFATLLGHFCILFSNYILWYYNCNMVLTLYLIYLSFKQWFKTWFARTIYKVLENNWILLKTCYVKEGYPYCRDFCQNQLSHFGTFLLNFIPNISHKKH